MGGSKTRNPPRIKPKPEPDAVCRCKPWTKRHPNRSGRYYLGVEICLYCGMLPVPMRR